MYRIQEGLKVKFIGVVCNAQTTIYCIMQHLDAHIVSIVNYCLAILWTPCTQLPLQNMLRHDKGNLLRAESTHQHTILSWSRVQVAAKLFETSSTHTDDRTFSVCGRLSTSAILALRYEVKHTLSSAAEKGFA